VNRLENKELRPGYKKPGHWQEEDRKEQEKNKKKSEDSKKNGGK